MVVLSFYLVLFGSRYLIGIIRNEELRKKVLKKDIVMPLRLSPSSKVWVVLRDVRPPTLDALHEFHALFLRKAAPLSVGFQQDDGVPGKLHSQEVLNSVKPLNLCARVIPMKDTTDQQAQHFEKLVTALEQQKLVCFDSPFPSFFFSLSSRPAVAFPEPPFSFYLD